MVVLLDDPSRRGGVLVVDTAADGVPVATAAVAREDLAAVVAARESDPRGLPRWVWDDTSRWYPPLLAAGVRVERCHDLRLCHVILRRSTFAQGSALAAAEPGPWEESRVVPAVGDAVATLFDELADLEALDATTSRTSVAAGSLDPVAELGLQLAAVASSTAPGRLRLLLAAESTGALIAAEMHHDGLPWSAQVHDELLTGLLGPRPAPGGRPARLEALAVEVRTLLDQPLVNLDSQPDLLRALRSAGLDLTSTRTYEIQAQDHPVVGPLLEYKKLSRLLSANGWAWMEAWVEGGRFRPDYVPGGVVTGRWASSGGGALQLPTSIRAAVRADPGWTFVVADAAQLEPRVLAAMSGDGAMALAGRHADLYQAVVDAGIVETRQQAKYAMLGAIYGATTGASAVLMPQLTSAYPRAVGAVEAAARAGERGEVVTTWLGRSSPPPGRSWQDDMARAASEEAGPEDVRTARRRRRDWGRFTRNFVVQGTAAEWALCWMAALRRRLRGLDGRPHLVFFLHDEVMVHAPVEVAEQVVAAVRDAADEAGRLLFGDSPVDFALDVSVVDSYDQAV